MKKVILFLAALLTFAGAAASIIAVGLLLWALQVNPLKYIVL